MNGVIFSLCEVGYAQEGTRYVRVLSLLRERI